MTKVAIIGAGYWGKNHVRTFAELGELAAVVDSNQATLQSFKQQYPDILVSENIEAVLASKNIQALVLASPAATHFALAKQALEAGKDVLAEKPLALSVAEAEQLCVIAKKASRVLMVGHILNFHPAVIKIRELLKSNTLGKVFYIGSHRLSWGKIRTEENVLWSFAPHDISLILSFVGKQPSTVNAQLSAFLQPGLADTAFAHLSFDGVAAHIYTSWAHPVKEHKLTIIAEKKCLVFDDTQAWDKKLALYDHKVELGAHPQAIKGEAEYLELEAAEPLKEQAKHFLHCVADRSEPLTSGEEGLRVLQVLAALETSAAKKGSPMIAAKNTDYYVHETAIVDEGAKIGKGSKVWHFSHVLTDCSIGEKCSLGQNVVMMQRSSLGNNVKVQNNVSIYEGVHVEDDCFLGPSMVFTNVVNPRSHVSRKDEYRDTFVRKGASIGANATVVCGHEIGQYAFVGAGAVVTKDVPAFALVYGNPARQYGWMCQCGIKLPFAVNDKTEEGACASCKTRYKRDALTLTMLG